MEKSRILTLATLKEKGACKEQVILFRKIFGDSVMVTESLASEYAKIFDFGWACRHLLSDSARNAFYIAINPARDAYYAAIKPASDAYYAAVKFAVDAYDAAANLAGDAYDAAIKPASDAYYAAIKPASDANDAAIKSADEAFAVAKARAFAIAYISDNA